MIKNIIFDFGGVLYDIDHSRTKNAFRQLGISNFEQLYGHAVQTKIFEDFEKGEISPKEFRNALFNQIPVQVTDKELDDAWNALLLGFDPRRLNFVQKISNNYTLYLLSNTNQIHYKSYRAELESLNLKTCFDACFEKQYYSHQIGMRKPDEVIYQFVVSDSQLNPAESVFIDDYDVNIAAAKKMGIQGLHLLPGNTIFDLFDKTGRLIV